MAEMKITNEDELRAWLESVEDWRVHSAFAARNALRCLPAALSQIDVEEGSYRGVDLTLATLRASLISGVAGTWPTPEMSDLVRSAAASAAAARSSASASSSSYAASAASSAASAAAARSASSASAYSDGERLQNASPAELFGAPLWTDGNPVPSWDRAWHDFQDRPDPKAHWVFWVKWYRSMLEGQPLDWDLQRRIALEITDEEWGEGVGKVAARIWDIETQYIRATTQVVEDPHDPGEVTARHNGALPKLILSRVNVAPPLIENPDSEKLTLAKEDGPAADPAQFALNNIKMALDHALKTCGENGFDASVEEVGILKLALESAPCEARYIAPLLHHAYCVLDRKLRNGEYPPEESLSFLSNQLKAHVISLSKDKPDVAEHIQSYGDLPEPQPVASEVVEELQDAAEKLEPVLEDDAREVVEEVTERMEPGTVPSKYSWALLVQWFAQIWLYLDKAKKHLGIADWVWEMLKKLF